MNTTRIRACLLAVALAAGACAGDDDASPDVTVDPTESSTTTTSMAESTTTTEDPRVAVEQAFFDQWDAFVEILEDPDPANPLIDQFFTGAARDSILDTISEFIRDGKRARLPDDPKDFSPKVVEVSVDSTTSATLFECTVDGIVIVDVATGAPTNDSVSTYEARNTFELVDGEWKLAGSGDVRDGDPACADL
ncbi:hypothetical protein [Actinospongicola halichondriae]|uniref:hypothetical protein n=1 Tax=Actinospongicola halichondriae TaxID=3236844 RepID=UPI003D4A0742